MFFRRISNLFFSSDKLFVSKIRMLLGFTPQNISLYKTAFRHRSVASNLKHGIKDSNERLEYLGDAILGFVIAELLFRLYPYKGEGFLTEMRSKIVNRAYLNRLAQKIGLDEFVEYDPKCVSSPSKRTTLLGDAFEALVGAIYIDRGFTETRTFLLRNIIDPHIDIQQLAETETNYKSKLLEWGQKNGKKIVFSLMEPADKKEKLFVVQVYIGSDCFGLGKSYNKKEAEKVASEKTCELLEIY